MKMVFVSNYFNHHQQPFCEEMYKILGMDFVFIETSPMSAERIKLGYAQGNAPAYVLSAYTDPQARQRAMDMVREADAVIAGGALEEYLRERLRSGKLVLRYTERPFKIHPSFLRRLYHGVHFHGRDLGNRNVYMLCASAYAAADYASTGMYKNRMYKWGYFPAIKEYDVETLLARKKKNTILWCGRFIDWKHPDDAVRLAGRLKKAGYDFQLDMIGIGEMEQELKCMVKDCGVEDVVHFLGAMPPEQVRVHMEEAGIYLFTSDRQEGWGVVLNEAMASGCAVVASDAAGATPFLVRDGESGLIYRSADQNMLFEKAACLLDDYCTRSSLGANAYHAVSTHWSPCLAAERLCSLARFLMAGGDGKRSQDLYETGICSKA